MSVQLRSKVVGFLVVGLVGAINSSLSADYEAAVLADSPIGYWRFNEADGSGAYWDGGTGSNPADPFAQVTRDGIVMFTSTYVSSANSSANYDMNTAAGGTLPVAFEEGSEMEVQLWDDDGDPNTNPADYMGQFSTDDALAFFYQGDNATEFTDVEVTGGNGVIFKLSGTFTYE